MGVYIKLLLWYIFVTVRKDKPLRRVAQLQQLAIWIALDYANTGQY